MKLQKNDENQGGGRSLAAFLRNGCAAIAALCVATAPSPSYAQTAMWKNNDGGNMNDAANWVDDYIPQAGDTLDFSAVTATYRGIVPISDDVQYETMTGFTVSLSRSDAARIWNFKYLNSPGCGEAGFNFWGNAHLNVEGKITYTGEKAYFISDTTASDTGGVTADEFEYTGPKGRHIMRAPNNEWGGIRARTFIHNGTGDHLYLSSYYKNANNTKARYVVGSGGFTFGDTQVNPAGRYYYIALDNGWVRTVRIDPYADYSFAANPTRADNMAIAMSNQCALELGTSDFDDPSVPRRVTCVGGIGGYLSGTTVDKVTITVDGCGFLFFNTPSTGARFPGTIKVKDKATFVIKDTATTAQGPMVFDSGTTLKVVQTRAAGIVELGGALTLAANSTLEFDLAANSATSALKVATLTMPASGKVKVKVSGVGRGGSAVLIENLPAGIMASQFEFVEKPFDNARVVVRDNKLMVEKGKGLMIIICSAPKGSSLFRRGA